MAPLTASDLFEFISGVLDPFGGPWSQNISFFSLSCIFSVARVPEENWQYTTFEVERFLGEM